MLPVFIFVASESSTENVSVKCSIVFQIQIIVIWYISTMYFINMFVACIFKKYCSLCYACKPI